MGKNWMEISKHFPGKTGKQIRERFLNKLDPNLRVEAWTKEEDIVILDMYKT
jgi:Myb-like DNA-binding domain